MYTLNRKYKEVLLKLLHVKKSQALESQCTVVLLWVEVGVGVNLPPGQFSVVGSRSGAVGSDWGLHGVRGLLHHAGMVSQGLLYFLQQ